MIARWWLSLQEVPQPVRAEHLHGALSTLLDATESEHIAKDKPYAYSIGQRGSEFGAWVSTFDVAAAERFVERAAVAGTARIGHLPWAMTEPEKQVELGFADLLSSEPVRAWEFEFQTPACVRVGNRSSPLLDVRAMLSGLHRRWSAWSDVDMAWSREHAQSVLVTDCVLNSVALDWEQPAYKGHSAYTLSGNLGRIRIEVTDRSYAPQVNALLRWGEFCGVGAYTNRGLGAFRLHETRQPGARLGAGRRTTSRSR